MALFLDPTGQSTYGIALCRRCSTKRLLSQLVQDPNMGSPFMVCPSCCDQYDPYRLAPRQPDNIVLPFNNPDVPLVTTELADDFAFMDGTGFDFMDGDQFEFME